VINLPSVQEAQAPRSWPLGDFALRAMRHSDATAWYAYLRDPRVVEHTSIPELTLGLVEAMVARELDGYVAGTSCRWALTDADDQLVGTCGFSNWSLPHSHAELVYDLAPSFWGRGLMRAAVHQVLTWALKSAGFNRVHAFVMTSNLPSIRLLEAVGLSWEGTLRSFRVARGVARDFHVYAVLRA
jgi:ribosomal-protein-alanine N-acetyltransferase